MDIRNIVTFETPGFPDDTQWTENDHLLAPGGHAIADAIIAGLRGAGFNVSESFQHEEHGWAFEVFLTKKRSEYCLVQMAADPDAMMLLLWPRWSFLERLIYGKNYAIRKKVLLDRIDFLLKHDARFSAIQWFTQAAFHSGIRKGEECP